MITASNAKMSRAGPIDGSKFDRMPRKKAASTQTARAIPMAVAKTRRLSIPMS